MKVELCNLVLKSFVAISIGSGKYEPFECDIINFGSV